MPTFVILLCAVLASALAAWKRPGSRPYTLPLAILLMPCLALEIAQYYWYRAAIPAQIEVGLPVSLAEESGFREGCGIAVYRLSGRTAERIAALGLRFFDGVDQARGHADAYYHYEAWQPTPVPNDWISEGSMFMCSQISDGLHAEIHAAAQQPGSYYTTKSEARLLVLPSIGLVVFAFYG